LADDRVLLQHATLYVLPAADATPVSTVDPMEARKALLQLMSSTNKDLYHMGVNDLKQYQSMFSEIIASPVRPVGVSLDDVKLQFSRVQRALVKDPVLTQYGDLYVLSSGTLGGGNSASHQKLQAIVNKWIVTQANVLKPTNISSMLTERQALVAASMAPDLPPVLKNQVEVAILQIDAVQLRMLNTKMEGIDWEDNFIVFKKAVILKAQNSRAASSNKLPAALIAGIEEYADLMGKIAERSIAVTAGIELVQSIKLIEKRARDNLSKLEQYQDRVNAIINAPQKRVNLALQGEVERVFAAISRLGTPAELLRNRPVISTYETTLKRALNSYKELAVDISVMEIRRQLQEMQKAQGIVAFSHLREFEKKIDDLMQKYGVLAIGQGNSDADIALGADPAFEDDGDVPAASKEHAAAKAKLQKSANEKAKRKEAEVTAINRTLVGVMSAMSQLEKAIMDGVFVLGSSFGTGDVTQDMAISLLQQINQSLIKLQYQEALTLNKQIMGQAKGAEMRVLKASSAVERSDTGEKFNMSSMNADLKILKLALIYGVGSDVERTNMRENVAEASADLLKQLLSTDFKDLAAKFDTKMENTTFALSTLDRLEKLVVVDDAQGPARQEARELIDRITTFLDKK
jgi:hypothetical protein